MSKRTFRIIISLIFISIIVFATYSIKSVPVYSDTPPKEMPKMVNSIVNQGFELISDDKPKGWNIDPNQSILGSIYLDSNYKVSGENSLRIEPNEKNTDKSHLLGVAQLLSAELMVGKRYRLSGYIKTTEGTGGAIIAATVGKDGKLSKLILLNQDYPRTEFVYQDKYIYIEDNIQSVIVGCSATGISGSVWFDDIELVQDDPIETIKYESGLTAEIDVNADNIIRNIPKTLYGTNVEWTWNAAGLWDAEKNRLRPEIMVPAKKLGLGPVRFPGGFFSDYYHWRDGVGPRDKRPAREHSPGADISQNVFGTDELADFCRKTGSEPLITINMITGTPQEAADWISYCNDKNNIERIANGYAEPYNIRFWEIGNEQYLKGDDAVGKTSHLPTDEYIRRFKEWASVMKQADKSIKIIAVGASNYGRYSMSCDENWIKKLLAEAGDKIDYLSVHNAYAPADASGSNASFYEVYQALFAFPILVKKNIEKINKSIEEYSPINKNRIKIAVTEWAPLFHILPSDKWIDHCKTLGSGIYAALIMKTFIESERVDLANSFKLSEYSFMGWINGDGTPKPTYYALQMFTKHFGSKLVHSTVKSPGYNSKGVSMIDAVNDVPYIDTISSLNGDKSKLYIIIINKHINSPIDVKIKINKFNPQKAVKVWTLTAPSIDANNGKDLIDYPGLSWARQIHAPQNSMFENGKKGTVITKMSTIQNASNEFTYTVQPISVTCLEMNKTAK